MSDLSSPPLTLLPVDATAAGPEESAAFAWPTPAFACYPAPAPLTDAEPCQIEGMNGRLMTGVLLSLDPAASLAKVRIPPARIEIPLRFNQFRRLTLTRPLAPLDDADASASFMAQRPAVGVKVHLKGAPAIDALSIGHLEDASGIFLFAPVDARGNVRRCFVPRSAYESVDIGERIGEVLVEQQAATPAQVNRRGRSSSNCARKSSATSW